MILHRSNLLKACEAVKGAVAEKGFVPILTHVYLGGDFMLGYNSEIGIKVKLDTQLDFSFNIKLDLFHTLLKNLEDEDVELLQTEKKQISLKCGKHRSKHSPIDEEFPKPSAGKNLQWTEVPAGFKEALERCVLGSDDDETQVALSAVYIAAAYIYGGCRSRAVRCTIDGLRVSPAILLPKKAVQEIIKLGNPKKMAAQDSMALFDYGDMTLLTRTRDASTFPVAGFESMFKGRQAGGPLPEGFEVCLRRLALFSKRGNGELFTALAQTPDDQFLTMRANCDMGQAEELLEKCGVAFGEKGVNPELLLRMLPYAEQLDWGTQRAMPFYLTGEVCNFEAIVSPMTP